MNIGEKIRAARIAKGMTQEQLGEILGVQKSAVAKYESGRVVNIKRSTLKKISEVLGIRASELIDEEIEYKKNDVHVDIMIRLQTDSNFLSVVEDLHNIDPKHLPAVKQFLSVLV